MPDVRTAYYNNERLELKGVPPSMRFFLRGWLTQSAAVAAALGIRHFTGVPDAGKGGCAICLASLGLCMGGRRFGLAFARGCTAARFLV